MAAIPEGHRPRRTVMDWRRHAITWLEVAGRRTDAYNLRRRFIDYLAAVDDPRTRTLYTTWTATAAFLDVSRATVARLYAELHAAGLLTTVARGRSAAHTPRATGRTKNEAPVYALMTPLAQGQQEPEAHDAVVVDGNETPDPVGGLKKHLRACARESSPKSSRYAAGIESLQRASRAAFAHLYDQRPGSSWSLHASMEPRTRLWRRSAQRQVIWELSLNVQVHVLRARDASTAAVAAEIRDFILAGWNVGDIVHALDWSPTGDRHWYSESGFIRAETWMRYRLAAWKREGEPIRSISQRRQAERDQAAAQRRAEAVAVASRRRFEAIQSQSPAGPGRAKVRQLLARRRAERR
ncbi:aminotransferase-like domain-containing protein [Rothia uropygialis]|uniref:hypothetical protein n=1 Tax=Kocuria sp. 36 TaxID=1415402 RepID=UPI001EE972B6|nr:hypothetical protein [Kocuria sp. 36]